MHISYHWNKWFLSQTCIITQCWLRSCINKMGGYIIYGWCIWTVYSVAFKIAKQVACKGGYCIHIHDNSFWIVARASFHAGFPNARNLLRLGWYKITNNYIMPFAHSPHTHNISLRRKPEMQLYSPISNKQVTKTKKAHTHRTNSFQVFINLVNFVSK